MLQRSDREGHGHHARPDAHAGPQPTQSHGTHPEALLGDRREQCDRPTEQHGEQVQTHRPEQDGAAPDEPQALEGVVDGLPGSGAGQTSHPRRRDEDDDGHDGDQGDDRQQVGQ